MAPIAGVALAIVAAIGLAGQALTIRLATRRGRSNDVLLVVMLVNVVVFVLLVVLFVSDPGVTIKSFFAFMAAGIVGTMLGRAFFYAGIKRAGASRAEPIKASMPLHATVLAFLLLGERVTRIQFVGVILIVVGVAFVSLTGPAVDHRVDEDAARVGLLFPLMAAFFFGLEPIFASVGLTAGTSVLVGLTIKTVGAFVVFLFYLAWRGEVPRPSGIPRGEVRWYVLAGLANTGFLLAYYAGLSISRVGVVVPITQMSPLLVMAASAVFLRKVETVTPRLVAGAVVIVTGGITVTLFG